MTILLEEKRNECQRLINNIGKSLPAILSNQLHVNFTSQDFTQLMVLIRENFAEVQPHLLSELDLGDIKRCIKIRNILAHQTPTSIENLNNAIESLKRCQASFGIQSAIVPLRVLACRKCGTCITRTAQPTVHFRDLAGQRQRVTRTYDVQSWSVANTSGELARRENTWYPGWVWTYTYCATCRQNNEITPLGFRFDWAPEDRINLNACQIHYLLARQAMIVVYPDGTIKDLTHVVSDGEVRRHRYALYESALREIHD